VGTIVVGTDGSESAEVALDFAAEEAALRGAKLRVVLAREVSERTQEHGSPVPEVLDNLQRVAEQIVNEAVARAKELQPGLTCKGEVLYGRPQTVLMDVAKDAILVVVGRRGQSGLASLLLGSVSRHMVNNAPCPVVVVPPAQ